MIKDYNNMYSDPVSNKTYSLHETENAFQREWTISLMCYKNNLNHYIECIWDNTDIGNLVFHIPTIPANIETKMDEYDKLITSSIKEHVRNPKSITKSEFNHVIKSIEDYMNEYIS